MYDDLAIGLVEVTPYAGVWIEIQDVKGFEELCNVTPYAGVWIEMVRNSLKKLFFHCHSLRGSVD